MNKLLFSAMASTLLLATACSSDEVLDIKTDADIISYKVTANTASRADDSYCNNNLPTLFSVYAATSDNVLYVDGDAVRREGDNTWICDNVRYWPENEKLDFYAQVNGDFHWNNGNPDLGQFVVADNVANQLDLMYAVALNQERNGNPVTLNFRHALSQVVFRGINRNNKMHVVVKGVSVGHVQNMGTFYVPNTDTGYNYTNHGDNDADVATLPGLGRWAIDAAAQTKQFDAAFEGITIGLDHTAITLPGDNHANGFTNAFMMIPQSVDAWNPEAKATEFNGAYFIIDVEMYNIAGAEYNAATDKPIYKGKTAVPVEINWQQGRRYIYTLIFGDGHGGWTPDPADPKPVLAEIRYDVTVDDFQPVDGNDPNNGIVPPVETNYTYAIHYNANGGDKGSIEDQAYRGPEASHTFTLVSEVPTLANHTFLGWAETADATEAAYAPAAEVTLNKENRELTLYAVWQENAKNTFTLVYMSEGNVWKTVTAEPSHAASVEIAVTSEKPVRADYDFLGWATTPDAATPNVGSKVTVKANETVTIYAVWVKTTYTYTVIFHSNNRGKHMTGMDALPGDKSADGDYRMKSVYTWTSTEKTQTYNVPAVALTDGNYTWLGWAASTTPDLDSSFPTTYTLTVDSPTVELYGIWGTPSMGGDDTEGGEGNM